LPDLSRRVLRDELLDRSDLPDEDARRSLLDLRRVNRWFGARKLLLNTLAKEVARHQLTEFSVLDIASGSADHPLAIIHWAQHRGLRASVFALEYQHRNLRLFRDELSATPHLHPFCADAFHAPVRDGAFDFVTCCHFLHHLTEDRAAALLASMSRWARRAVIVSDLERHAVPYQFFSIFSRFFVRSYVSRADGLTSLAQSFRKPELERIAARAGLAHVTVERHWPFHLLLESAAGDAR
jgi:ubiquinone/menaquinone biosynthesis C-methylase UbiE